MQQTIAKIQEALAGEKGGLKDQLLMAPKFRKEELKKRPKGFVARKSAILLLLNPFSEDLSLIFTKRSSKLKVHRGQVSFPGGQKDKEDKSLQETALRETCEEIGICGNVVKVIGNLSDLFIPPSNFDVYCIIGVLQKETSYSINTDEVESVVEVPLKMLLDSKNIKQKIFTSSSSGEQREAPYYDVMGLEIWGATAMIVSELLELIRRYDIKF
jgi:8-oxo-dGTP pyrophosphatase MutT (NUDIX family)